MKHNDEIRSFRKAYEEKKKTNVLKGGCFVCEGPHSMKDCPKRSSLFAIVEEQERQRSHDIENTQLGHLQLLNTLKAMPLPQSGEGHSLMYVEAIINERPTKVMANMGLCTPSSLLKKPKGLACK